MKPCSERCRRIVMAEFNFSDLQTKYKQFRLPAAVVKINNQDFSKNKHGLGLTDIDIELTCGFEASVASFHIYNSFDHQQSQFLWEHVKPYILLGASVTISIGYCTQTELVFCGYIARLNFIYDAQDTPSIQVTAMDVKGIMMAGSYARQIKVQSYGEAVREILSKSAYQKLRSRGIITDLKITDTPDKKTSDQEQQTAAQTIEMVNESDYEFVVKAAKKFNYEFYTDMGTVYFRKAKAVTDILMELGPDTGLHTIDVEYDITGIVEQIEVRGMHAGKAKVISAQKKLSNKLSNGNDAGKLIKGSEKVYIDTTVDAKETAENRVLQIAEETAYRFGSLSCEVIGMPELVPGRFIRLVRVGQPMENNFYLTKVRHIIEANKGYYTKIEGKASSLYNGQSQN